MSDDLLIVPLTRQIVDLDLVAYLSSPSAIKTHSAGRWPVNGFTREENCRLIEIHEQEHAAHAAYAYALLTVDGVRELGCVYLRPLSPYLRRTRTRLGESALDPSRTAIATFWLLDDNEARPSTEWILGCMRTWLHQWGGAHLVFRCLPDEINSVDALSDAPGLRQITAFDQTLPYLWFADQASPPAT